MCGSWMTRIGVLSYYRSQEDVPVSCRGSISLKVAKLWIDSSDRNRFDIIGKGNVRYHLRAEHPMETKRWVIALTESKQWLQDNAEFEKTKQKQLEPPPLPPRARERSDSFDSDRGDAHSDTSTDSRPVRFSNSLVSAAEDAIEEEEYEEKHLVFSETYHATMNSALAGVQYQDQLMMAVSKLIEPKQSQLVDTYRRASSSLQQTLQDLLKMIEDREMYWAKRLEREEELKRIWDENLRELAFEHNALEEKATKQVSLLESQAKMSGMSLHNGTSSPPKTAEPEEDEEFFDALDDYEAHNPRASLEASKASVLQDLNGSVINECTQGYPLDGAVTHRKLLPLAEHPKGVKVEISLWSVLKNNIGKDLSKIALPVFFNEPLSMLQRLCEEMEYSTLLDIASQQENSLHRIQFVGAFAMSNYSSTLGRTSKPFNPLLGETYEYVRKDRGFRYISEQVSHHPVCFRTMIYLIFPIAHQRMPLRIRFVHLLGRSTHQKQVLGKVIRDCTPRSLPCHLEANQGTFQLAQGDHVRQ